MNTPVAEVVSQPEVEALGCGGAGLRGRGSVDFPCFALGQRRLTRTGASRRTRSLSSVRHGCSIF